MSFITNLRCISFAEDFLTLVVTYYFQINMYDLVPVKSKSVPAKSQITERIPERIAKYGMFRAFHFS